MNHIVASVPVIPVRKEPAHRSEMTSQLLFGETASVIEEEKSGWIRIRCDYDGYEGWAQESQFLKAYGAKELEQTLASAWINLMEYEGQGMRIPLGSVLNGIGPAAAEWNGISLSYKGEVWTSEMQLPAMEVLLEIAFKFLNVPYLWGGKSVFGTDCSGFTQSVFRFMRIPLWRDAWQQATQGERIESFNEYRPGDLAFFDNEGGRITHVGILLADGRIIHASGSVRVDKVDPKGIVHSVTGKRTHKLKQIQRFGIRP